MYPRSELLRAKPIFLLEINWGTFVYRFATMPVHLDDDGVYLPFTGHLDNPEYQERSELLGIDIQEKSIPLALYFAGVDISLQEMSGNSIEGSSAELSYILEDIHTDYEQRVIIAKGFISQPVFGHPDKSIEYVECSLESGNIINSTSLLYSTNARYVMNEEVITDTSIPHSELQEGKILGLAFGKFTFIGGYELYSIPAYFYGYGPTNGNYFVLTSHAIISSQIKIKDTEGNILTANTEISTVYWDNRFFSYTRCLDPNPGTLRNPITYENEEYWAYITEGMPNPVGTGVLEGGGDICIWALTATNVQIDYDAWHNVRTYLNEYKFAGYLQDPEVTGLEFLERHIIPYLPLEIIQGNNGLSPRLNLLVSGTVVIPTEHITAGGVFYRTGPIIPLSEPQEICNAVKVRFAWQGKQQAYFGVIDVGPDQPGLQRLCNEVIDEYSILSVAKYGKRQKNIDLEFVYDYDTAARIAQDYIRLNAMPKLGITYNAVGFYGWLQVGDIIELTDTDINIEKQKVQIIQKRWLETYWEFTLQFEINHISNLKLVQ
jgi:hypothetical protein